MTLDFVAKRYGTLPSRVFEHGNNLDIQVAEFAVAFEVYQHHKAENSQRGQPTVSRQYSTEDLANMIKEVRKGNKNDSKTDS